uniref:Uncharacterized protein n=1 Tax=Ursus maritimus TaxID=29073 RepID=A0A452V6Z6_URSMA
MPVSLKWLCRLIAILSENSIRCLSSQKEFVLGLNLVADEKKVNKAAEFNTHSSPGEFTDVFKDLNGRHIYPSPSNCFGHYLYFQSLELGFSGPFVGAKEVVWKFHYNQLLWGSCILIESLKPPSLHKNVFAFFSSLVVSFPSRTIIVVDMGLDF